MPRDRRGIVMTTAARFHGYVGGPEYAAGIDMVRGLLAMARIPKIPVREVACACS